MGTTFDFSSRHYYSQGLRLHYLDWGNADAPPLILVHGGQDHCRNWDWVVAHLRDHYHVMTPDLRGHGDSEWSADRQYPVNNFVYDLAQLVDQQGLAPVTLIGHSLGGSICLRYAGAFPEKVTNLVAIEGLGFGPASNAKSITTRLRDWIETQQAMAVRRPRRYATIEEARERMRDANPHLNAQQAHHLVLHGVNRNDDGTYSWKFDNYVRSPSPTGDHLDLPELWRCITCPVLLAYGSNSWASNPAKDGRASHFSRAEVAVFEQAGHWLHHDQLDRFVERVKIFLDI